MACSDKCRAVRWRRLRAMRRQHRDEELSILALAWRAGDYIAEQARKKQL